jgi:beta-barrel assembly-enhancing protease
LIIALTACSAGISLYSPQEQVEIGKQIDKEIRANPKEYPIDQRDAAVKDYIDKKIFRPIVESPAVKYRGVFTYQLEIIHKDSVINAFAVPGGYVYVYTGLLKYVDSEAALAGVLAHEIAHCENEHASKRMFDAQLLQTGSALLLKDSSPELLKIGLSLGTNGWLMKNSRKDEDQADECSFNYLRATRFYPGGVKFMFEKMKDDGAVSAKTGSKQNALATLLKGAEVFFASHPDPIERIDVTNKRLSDAGIPLKTYKNSD